MASDKTAEVMEQIEEDFTDQEVAELFSMVSSMVVEKALMKKATERLKAEAPEDFDELAAWFVTETETETEEEE
jgi:hypothetical protein